MKNEIVFKGKHVTVLGLGVHGGGIDTVQFLVARGAFVTVTDLQSRAELHTSIAKIGNIENVKFVLGQHRHKDFDTADMVIKTPSVPWDNEYIVLAQSHNIPVYTDASLFYELIDRQTIGITGSKGKTTTAQMIMHILTVAQKKPVAVGIGQAPVLGKLDELTKESIPVCELSSWRLASMGRMKQSPQIAVVTNLLNDHRNYYHDFALYEKDKFFITQNQKEEDVLILNADDPRIAQWADKTKAHVVLYAMQSKSKGHAFFIENGTVCEQNEKMVTKLYSLEKVHNIRGAHNQSNMLAATAVARMIGIAGDTIKQALKTFSGVAHRFETVAVIDGVHYINDTAATMPDAAIASIKTCQTKPIVIAGGTDKKLDFDTFAQVLVRDTKAFVLLAGDATQKIAIALQRYTKKRPHVVETMTEAVAFARTLAEKGDCILLSPGAASFGLFAHEFARGDAFISAVKKYEEK